MKRFEFAAALAAFALLPGCVVIENRETAGPIKDETISIDKGRAEKVRVEVRIGAGEVKVSGGAAKLMQGDFHYNMPFLKPSIRYDDSSFRGTLIVTQKAENSIRLSNNMRNDWSIRLNDDTPVELELHMGAGESKLDLGSLNLRRVEVHMGVGEMKMDLRGTPRQDYDVEVQGGVGEATIYLPKDAGVTASAKGGIGSIETRNLRREGSRYVNDAYGKAKRNISVEAHGGVGQIRLIAD